MSKTARSPFFCRSPFPQMSGTEGRTGRGLRESAVCGIKVIFARVAELVDALDLESSGLSIRVQVPSLAPEFAKTSPACCGTSLFSGRLSGSVFPGPRQGRGRRSGRTGKSSPLAHALNALSMSALRRARAEGIVRHSFLPGDRGLYGQAAACSVPLPSVPRAPAAFPLVSPKERCPS